MAADATVYLNNGATVDLKLTGSTLMRSMLALKLLAYGSNIKSLFYLDGVVEVTDGTSVGFIGYVFLDGDNISMHADARKSQNQIKNASSRVAVLLNDGGLNTRSLGNWINNVQLPFNDAKVKCTFKAAYYVNTTAYGLKYRYYDSGSWTAWQTINVQLTDGNIAAGATVDKIIALPNVLKIADFEIKAYSTNAEGTIDDDVEELTTQLIAFYLQDGGWSDNATAFYAEVTELKTKLESGEVTLYLYPDLTGNITTAKSLWIDSRYYYSYGYDTLSDKYILLDKIDSTPPVDPTPINRPYNGYSDVSRGACTAQIESGIVSFSGTLFLNDADDLWYETWIDGVGFSDLAADGYYGIGDVSGVTSDWYILSGELFEY